MASYNEIASMVKQYQVQQQQSIANIAKAISEYLASGANVTETDLYNMIKALPEDIQVAVLVKALTSKSMAKAPSYVQQSRGRGRGIL
jgi:methionine synthase I (cobalamin-dependent)